ncbi:hypothetical protein ABZ412_14395 [Nocardia sp. NPDC005746]|uniref:hypothetical protein n=1 Tax=unclassified Nocardia TaxID=2637762 RepID=UPI0033E22226
MARDARARVPEFGPIVSDGVHYVERPIGVLPEAKFDDEPLAERLPAAFPYASNEFRPGARPEHMINAHINMNRHRLVFEIPFAGQEFTPQIQQP